MVSKHASEKKEEKAAKQPVVTELQPAPQPVQQAPAPTTPAPATAPVQAPQAPADQKTPAEQKVWDEKARKADQEKRYKIAEKFSNALIEKFKRSVKCVVVYGSTAKGTQKETSDLDIFVVMDDTQVEQEVPKEVKDRIWNDMLKVAQDTDKNITLQAFMFLTEFWESIRMAEPVIIAILRYGVPVFDVGVFGPAQRMLHRGKIPTTFEAVEKRMKAAPEFVLFAKNRIKSSGHYLEQAMASAGNGALMLIGRMPQNKEDVPKALKESFVDQGGVLEAKYVKMAEDIIAFAKMTEHVADEDVKDMGVKADLYINMTDEFIKRMDKLIKDMDDRKKSTVLMKTYKTFLKANVGALKYVGVQPPEELKDLPKVMGQHFPEVQGMQQELFDRLGNHLTAVRDGKGESIPEREIYELREKTKVFVIEVGKLLKDMQAKGLIKSADGKDIALHLPDPETET